jgi:SNF2 family DNA or RNA helicase
VLRTYKCGHAFLENTGSATVGGPRDSGSTAEYTSCTGKKAAFHFQVDGIQFAERTGYNCLIADPMGLGKTIQALLAAREARNADGSLRFRTILTIVKSATTYQWYGECKEWFDPGLWSVFMIQGTKGFIPPGFRMYILSMDTLSRFMSAKNGGLNVLKGLGVDLVIVDECHSFKNPDSARSQALVAFLQDISQTEIQRDITLTCNLCKQNATSGAEIAKSDAFTGTWTETAKIKLNIRNAENTISYRHSSQCPKCGSRIAVYQDRIVIDERERNKGLVLLSGTPIKNRADEYFVPLNLLRPDIFTSLERFKRTWLEQDSDGKYKRIKPYLLERFRETTSSFIIRREKNAVLSLPEFRRAFNTVSIDDERLRVAYNKALADLQANADKANLNYFDVQENLMTLRRITGMGKIPAAVEYVMEFLDEAPDDEKIAIGIHHEAVRNGIAHALESNGVRTLQLSGEDSAENKNRIVQRFNNDPACRVLIVNMLAGGVGLNLQVCNNTLVLERQWNAADEEQFEGRFHRQGQTRPVLADYMLAQGTIDTYFSALVEQKRQICGESLDGWDFASDPDALKDLIAQTVAHKL